MGNDRMKICRAQYIVLALFAIIFLYCSCNKSNSQNISQQQNAESSFAQIDTPLNFAQESSEVSGYERYKRILFEDFVNPASLYSKEYGWCLDEAYQDGVYRIYIYQAEAWRTEDEEETLLLLVNLGGKSPFSPWMLMVDCNGQIFYDYIGTGMAAEFYLGDIDGDLLDEILAWTSYGNGGSGAYENVIYRFENGVLNELYRGDYENHPIDTGFELLLNDGYQYTIQNKITGFSITFTDMTEHAITIPHFEDDGTVSEWVKSELPYSNGENVRNYFRFEPIDIDEDGICEIIVEERFGFASGPRLGIGFAISGLKYDSITNSFIPVKSGFWPDAYTDLNSHLGSRKEYEQDWWK